MNVFGAKPATSSAFNFGSTKPSTTGSTLFGTTTQTQSAGTLFGTQPTSQSSSLFGVKPGASTGMNLFGNTTSSTGGNIFSTTTSTASKPLFGAATTASLPLFGGGTTSTAGGGFFGTTSITSKPGGLFSSTVNQPQIAQTSAVQSIAPFSLGQELAALIQAVTNARIYGDERDNVVTLLNQLVSHAAPDQAKLYFAHKQPVPITKLQPFYRFNTIVFNDVQNKNEKEDVVSLVIRKPAIDVQNQKQALIDAMARLFGNKPSLKINLDNFRDLPDLVENNQVVKQSELTMNVIEEAPLGPLGVVQKRPINATDLYQFLQQNKQNIQTQMCIFDVALSTNLDGKKRESYLENPPAGIDPSMWYSAISNNPNSSSYLPVPVRGFNELQSRIYDQAYWLKKQTAFHERMSKLIARHQQRLASIDARMATLRNRNDQQAHQLLNVLLMYWRRMSYAAFSQREEEMSASLDDINMRLNANNQLVQRLDELKCSVTERPMLLTSVPVEKEENDPLSQDEALRLRIMTHLEREDNELKRLSSQLERDQQQVKSMAKYLSEKTSARVRAGQVPLGTLLGTSANTSLRF